jgi:hypothetical protein
MVIYITNRGIYRISILIGLSNCEFAVSEKMTENTSSENITVKDPKFKLELGKLNLEDTPQPQGVQSARARTITPRNQFTNPMMSPRKDQFVSPREEHIKFMSKRTDLCNLVNDSKKPILIDEAEDIMLLELKNQDTLSPQLRITTNSNQDKRKSFGTIRESHFHVLSEN